MSKENSSSLQSESSSAHQLADMQQINWEQSLSDEQTFLRLASPSDEQLAGLQQSFQLDDLHITDIRNPEHPPHLTLLGNDTVMIILRFPVEVEKEDASSNISSVTILADRRMCALIWPEKRYHRFSDQDLAGLDVRECVGKILHMLVDYLLSRVNILREQLDEFEDECLADAGNADLEKLMLMRKELASLARLARGNLLVIDKLLQEEGYRESLRLSDAHEHMNRAASMAELKADQALNVMQAVQSLLSQRLNEVMRFLAVITVILTPMGVIAGIFGMNFTHMEVLAYPSGFAISLWIMLVLGVILAAIFRIKRWW